MVRWANRTLTPSAATSGFVRPSAVGPTDENAARLYDGWCGRDYAQDFLLYKLYTHAAAFIPRG